VGADAPGKRSGYPRENHPLVSQQAGAVGNYPSDANAEASAVSAGASTNGGQPSPGQGPGRIKSSRSERDPPGTEIGQFSGVKNIRKSTHFSDRRFQAKADLNRHSLTASGYELSLVDLAQEAHFCRFTKKLTLHFSPPMLYDQNRCTGIRFRLLIDPRHSTGLATRKPH